MTDTDLLFTPAAKAVSLIRARKLSPVEYVDTVLEAVTLLSASASSDLASSVNFRRRITGRGCAKARLRSDTATPIVFSPRSIAASVWPAAIRAGRSVTEMVVTSGAGL